MGGIWEYLIWIVCNLLELLFFGVGIQMDGKVFRIFMKEVECIVYFRLLIINYLKQLEVLEFYFQLFIYFRVKGNVFFIWKNLENRYVLLKVVVKRVVFC